MVENDRPVFVLAHALDFGSDDRVDDPRDVVADVERLAPVVDLQRAHTGSLREREAPAPLRPRPLAEAGLVRRVRLLVAGLEEAGEGAVRRAGQEPAIPQELVGLVERLERAVRRQPAEVSPPLLEPI